MWNTNSLFTWRNSESGTGRAEKAVLESFLQDVESHFSTFHIVESHFSTFDILESHFSTFHIVESHFSTFDILESHFSTFHKYGVILHNLAGDVENSTSLKEFVSPVWIYLSPKTSISPKIGLWIFPDCSRAVLADREFSTFS